MQTSNPIPVPQVGEVFRHMFCTPVLAQVVAVDRNGVTLVTDTNSSVHFNTKVWTANGHAWCKYRGERVPKIAQWAINSALGIE